MGSARRSADGALGENARGKKSWNQKVALEKYTPPKTNMEPENDGSQKGISSSRGSGSMLVFGGVQGGPGR